MRADTREVKGRLWPVYLVADQSESMSPHIDQVNKGLSSIRRALLAQPMTAAKVRLTIVGFSDTATASLHLADLRGVEGLPRLVGEGPTHYGAAFDELRRLIPEDVAKLKADGYAVHRPAVFFLSDGEPTDDPTWTEAHRRLVDRSATPAAPNVIAFGIGAVRPEVIRRVATRPEFAFSAPAEMDIGRAIGTFFSGLLKSIVASTRAESLTVAFRIPFDEV
jgi:uncharacterized protein YegL